MMPGINLAGYEIFLSHGSGYIEGFRIVNKLALPIVIVSVVGTSTAYAYQSEFGAQLTSDQKEYGVQTWDTNTIRLSGTWFTTDVDTSKGPLAEAPFLSKSTGISLSYARANTDYENAYFPEYDPSYNMDSWSGDSRWVTAERSIIFDVGYDYFDTEIEGESYRSQALSLGVGTYITERSTLMLNYYEFYSEDVDIADSISIHYRSVFGDSNQFAVAASLERSKWDENYGGITDTGIVVAASYYPSKHLGLTAKYAIDTATAGGEVKGLMAPDNKYWTLGAEWFAKENLRLGLRYFGADANDTDTEGVKALLSFRY